MKDVQCNISSEKLIAHYRVWRFCNTCLWGTIFVDTNMKVCINCQDKLKKQWEESKNDCTLDDFIDTCILMMELEEGRDKLWKSWKIGN